MKRIIAFLLMCFFFIAGHLQCQEKFHIVDLLPNKDQEQEETDFYIGEIIDNRVFKNNIGIAQKGPFNKKVPSKFSFQFEDHILEYLYTIFKPAPGKDVITLRINQLVISEYTTAFKETGKAVVSMDVLQKEDDKYYILGSYIASAEKNSMDVTGKHDDRIREILKNCIMQFISEKDSAQRSKRLFDLTKVNELAILSNSPKKGFYHSFNDLYRNISIVDTMVIVEKTNENILKIKTQSKKHVPYYAFYNGTNFYINAQDYSADNYFVRTVRLEHFLIFKDRFVDPATATGMSLAFGLLGALASNEDHIVLLNLNSGSYLTIDRKRMRLLLKTDYSDLYSQYVKRQKDLDNVITILGQVFANEGTNRFIGLYN